MFLLLAKEVLTMPLTILAALEDSLHDFTTREIISVHLIGATEKELRNLTGFEEIMQA